MAFCLTQVDTPRCVTDKSQKSRIFVDERTFKIASRVLIVENDRDIKAWLTEILGQDGYEVVSARDGRDAYKLLQSDADFTGAVLNLSMPYLDGAELISYMRTEKRLMIFAEAHIKDLVNGMTAGATVLLPKPFTKPVLQHVLRMMLHTKLEDRENLLPPVTTGNESARKVAGH